MNETIDYGKDLDHNFQRNVITAINNEDDVVFVTYSILEGTEEKIIFTLAKILEKHDSMEIFTPILTCIRELIANATKANAKKILIDDGIIKNPDNTREVVKKIRKIINPEALLEYGIKAKKRGLSTRVYLKIKNNNLTIEVINNIPLTARELKRMQEKIVSASKYDNIAEFFMENPDLEAEGMGLGLSMIVVILKNINISYKNFILTTDKKSKTYTKILVPLSNH